MPLTLQEQMKRVRRQRQTSPVQLYRNLIGQWIHGASGRRWQLKRFFPGVVSIVGPGGQPIVDFEEPPSGIVGTPTYIIRLFILPDQLAFADVRSDFNLLPRRPTHRQRRR